MSTDGQVRVCGDQEAFLRGKLGKICSGEEGKQKRLYSFEVGELGDLFLNIFSGDRNVFGRVYLRSAQLNVNPRLTLCLR